MKRGKEKNIVLMNSESDWMIGSAVWIIEGDFNPKDICRYGKAEFPARVLPRGMQTTDFLFWYYRGGSCSLNYSEVKDWQIGNNALLGFL